MTKRLLICIVFVISIVGIFEIIEKNKREELLPDEVVCNCGSGEKRSGDYCYRDIYYDFTSEECADEGGKYSGGKCYVGWHNACELHKSVKSISLNKTSLTVRVGEEFSLTAIFDPSDAYDKSIDWSYEGVGIYMSYPYNTKNFKGHASTPGKGVIYATSRDGNHTVACDITVIADDNSNTEEWYKDYYYKLDSSNKTITLYKYNGGATYVYVPKSATIDNKTYTTVISGKYLLNKDHYLFSDNNNIKTVEFQKGVQADTDLSYIFKRCNNLEKIIFNGLDTSNVTKMSNMFSECKSLKSLDLSNFNTDKVTDMHDMFSGCESLESLDLSSFNTTKVTDMTTMFYGCHKLSNLNIKSFNTSNVTNMHWMFADCPSLKTLDLSSFNTSNVTSMESMFYGYNSPNLERIYVSNLWNTSKVTDSDSMFLGQKNLIGGNGTKYDANNIDKTYARIDSSTTPGYLTLYEEIELLDNSKMKIVNDFIKISPKQNNVFTLLNFKTNIKNTENLSFYNSKNTKINKDNDAMGTGSRIKMKTREYYVILAGDINNDGDISLADVAKAYSFVRGKTSINQEPDLMAIDVNNDTKQSLADISKIYSFVRKNINSL